MIRSSLIERLVYWIALSLLCWGLLTFLIWPILSALHTAFVRDGDVAMGAAISELAASRRVRMAVPELAFYRRAYAAAVQLQEMA